MAIINKENIGFLHDKLTITLDKNDYMPKVESGLKKIAKTATMPGFRPGLVPVGMIKKMYGKGILADELSKCASEKMEQYIRDNNIQFLGHPLSIPLKEELDLNTANEFNFVFEIGLQPEFQVVAPNGKSNLTEYKIKVDDELLEKEIGYEQTRNGKSEEVETMEAEDVLSLEIKGENFEKNIHLLLSKIKNEDSRKQLMALKKNDTATFDFVAAFNNDTEELIHNILNIGHEEFEKINAANLQITVKTIYRLKKAELNEVLFEKVFPTRNITTIEAFKTELKKELENVYARETARKANTDLHNYLVANTPMEFPKDFLKKWMQSVSKNPVSVEEIEKSFDSFVEDLKWTLIKNKIIVENKLQITQEDMKNKVMEYLREAYKGMEDAMLEGIAQRIMSNEKETEYMAEQLISERVFDYLRKQTAFNSKEVSMEEFDKIANPHHHH